MERRAVGVEREVCFQFAVGAFNRREEIQWENGEKNESEF
jgi:hypothetical protein